MDNTCTLGRMRHSPKGSSPKPEGTKHVLVQRITSQRVKVQNFKGQSGQSPNSLSPKTDSPKQDLVQKGGSKKAMGLSPGRTKSDLAKNIGQTYGNLWQMEVYLKECLKVLFSLVKTAPQRHFPSSKLT